MEYFAKTNNKEHLLLEFSDKNIKEPNNISFSTIDKYLWNCPKCTSEYSVSVSSRTNTNTACPYCHGKSINETNNLWVTRPDIAKLLFYPEDGYTHTMGSSRKVDWRCSCCNYKIKSKSIANIVRQGLSCPKCSDGISYPEKFMISVLNQLKTEFDFQKTFDWSNKKKYDFYLPLKSMIIETHGEQHFRYTGFKRTLEKEQENDKVKASLAKENKVGNYLIIDCSKSTIEYIKTNILNSELAQMFDLNRVDWLKCNEFALKSLVKIVCNLWDSTIIKQVKS